MGGGGGGRSSCRGSMVPIVPGNDGRGVMLVLFSMGCKNFDPGETEVGRSVLQLNFQPSKGNPMTQLSSSKTISSFLLAAGAIAVAGCAAAASPAKMIAANDTVHCYKVNDCKGTSDCKTAESNCKGMNSCKGHGFKSISAKACMDKGGAIGDM